MGRSKLPLERRARFLLRVYARAGRSRINPKAEWVGLALLKRLGPDGSQRDRCPQLSVGAAPRVRMSPLRPPLRSRHHLSCRRCRFTCGAARASGIGNPMGARQLPTIHVSVPWHDGRWARKVCANPRGNTSCLMLPRVAENKDDNIETSIADTVWGAEGVRLPACYAERRACMHLFGKAPFMTKQSALWISL